MDQNEQTQSAFSPSNRRDAYLKARAETPEQKGLSYSDLFFDNIYGLDNEYESTGETLKKALREDTYGTLGNMATGLAQGIVDFVRNPYEGVKGIVEDTAGSIKRVATEDLDEKLNRMYGVSYEEATPDQVTKAREVVASDVMTVAGVIPVAKVVGTAAKGAAALGKGAVDALPEAAQAARKSIADEFGSLPLGEPVQLKNQSTVSELSSNAKPKLTKPRMFATTEDGKLKLNPEALMEFYSPTVEAIKSMEFPSKGYKGSELVKFLQTKAPGVRRAELDAMDIGIDPMKRYTREEAVALAENKAYKVTAKEYDDPANTSVQRQQVKDREVSSTTLVVDAIPNSPDSPAFYPNLDRTHYNDSTIVHSRVSIRENNNGEKYLLVEEIQSDLVQKGAAKSRGPVSRDVAYSELLENMPMGKDDKAFFKKNKEALTEYFKIGSEDTRLSKAKKDGLPVSVEEEAKLEARSAKLRETFDIEEMGRAFGNKDYDAKAFLNQITNYSYESPPIAEKRMRAIGNSPLTEDSDAVRLALQVAMSKASQESVSSIVIPNLQRIVTSGRARLGSKEYDSYMGKSSGFTKTYKDGVQNFISQLKEQFGDGIQIKTIELPYFSDKGYANGVEQTLDNTAIQIDFSGLKDVDFNIGSFAEGGMVEEEQMNRLMQQGGMADDGMSREPITGNNIPPGALASEVRDDVDAKLSGGEYVVPADVLRYYGVRFFEDLRSQAKQGMMDMESAGRIGGVPVDSRGVPMQGQDEELTPEEEQMLAQAMSSTSGMAEGGDVFNRGDFTLTNTGSDSVIEDRLYFNPNTGQKKTISFMSGTAMGSIPAGFVPWTQALQDTYNATKAETPKPRSNNNDRNDNKRDTTPSAAYSSWADQNYNAITSNPFEFGMNALQPQEEADSKGLAGGLIGILTGKDKDIQNIANANAALKIMESKGLTGSENYKILTEKVKAYVAQISPLEQGLVLSKVAGTGNAYMRAIEEKAKQTPAAAPAASPVTTPSAAAPAAKSSGGQSADERREGTGTRGGGGVSSVGGSSNRDRLVTPAKPSLGGGVDGPRPTPKPTPTVPQGGRAGFEEGGLVTKPKKTRAKTKGLAGKQ